VTKSPPSGQRANASQYNLREALAEEHLDGQFIDKFLLAIIRAHPDQEPDASASDAERLNAAKRALLGSGRKAKKEMSGTASALRWMAYEYIRDRGGPALSLGPDPYEWLERQPAEARSVKDLAHMANVLVRDARRRGISKTCSGSGDGNFA